MPVIPPRFRHVLAFVRWWLPVCSVCIGAKWLLQQPLDGLGWMASIILAGAAGGLLMVFVAALLTGWSTRTLAASLLGALCGLPVALTAIGAMEESDQQQAADQRRAHEEAWAKQREEFQALKQAISAGDSAEILRGFKALRHFSTARAVCALSTDLTFGTVDTLFEESSNQDPDTFVKYPIPSARLMRVAEVLASNTADEKEKDTVLYAALRMLTRREPVESFAPWIALWKRTHGPEPLKVLVSEHPLSPEHYNTDCPVSSTLKLADLPLTAWGDDAIVLWLDSGLAFVPAQHRIVLNHVTRARTLAAAVKSGVNPNAAWPSAGADEVVDNDPIMPRLAREAPLRMDQSTEPEEVAALIEEFVRQGANLRAGRSPDETACKLYLGDETVEHVCPCKPERPGHAQAQERAVKRTRAALCAG